MVSLLTIEEVAAILHKSIKTVKRRPIPFSRDGRSRLYDPRDVDAYAQWEARFSSELALTVAIHLKMNPSHDEWVYFARCGDYVKVGYSRYPDHRVGGFSTSSPYPITIIGKHPGGRSAEQAVQAALRRFHHFGEWFELAPDLAAAIEEVCNG